jgi:Tol biopolymer transport system component
VALRDSRDGAIHPGDRLGPYDVTGRLGGGGMGEVYRAHDSRFGRDVALKVLPQALASNPERLRRFELEARATGTIDHPGILAVHDFGCHEGWPYLATELLEGDSLGDRLAFGPLPVRKAVEIGIQVASALAAAHDRGILHRDLKPDNIFVTRDGRAKILDFGLAKLQPASPLEVDPEKDTVAGAPDPISVPGILVGTMAYLSPEQARGEPADVRSDIFGLGLVLYQMLTGRAAFLRGSVIETLNAIIKEDPAEMTTSPGTVPPSLERIVRRCLEKEPGERFQNARDLAFALQALSWESQGSALRPSGPARLPRWAPPLARRLGAVAAAGVLLAAAAWLVRAPPAPRIVGSRPLLNGFPGRPAAWVTDGERVYFSLLRDGRFQTFQMSLAGGAPAPVAAPARHSVVMDVSRRRSALLVAAWDGGLSDPATHDVPLWMVPLPGGSPTRLAANGMTARWSPDAETIACVGGSDNYARKSPSLIVARTDGSASKPLWAPAAGDVWVWSAAWSGDGRWLLVGLHDRHTGESWIAEMPSDASRPPRRLADTVAGAWTPDRRYLVGQVGGDASGARTPAERKRVDLFVQPRRTWKDLWREPARLPLSFGPASLFGPVLSPDGRTILAGGRLSRMEPMRLDPATKRFERLPGDITGGFIDYSPDGAWVAWVDAADLTLWRARRDGSDRLQLTIPPLEVGLVRWSPDGTRLAFAGGRANGPDAVYLVSRNGGAPEPLAESDPGGVWDPCWLPDGQTLAWGNLRVAGASIKSVDVRTRRLTAIPGSERMMGPKCSPQGTILAEKEWGQTFWLYRPGARRWEEFWRATANGVTIGYPSWSRDGRSLYGLSLDDEWAVFRLTVEDRRLERVAGLGAIVPTAPSEQPWMGLDPEDAPLILRDTGVSDVYALEWEAE